MAAMWRLLPKNQNHIDKTKVICKLVCNECASNQQVLRQRSWNNHSAYSVTQIREYSDGRKGFFENIYNNIKEGLSKDKNLNENLKKFREEREKLESSEAIKQARQKFESIESDTTEGFKKGFEDVRKQVSEKLEEVQKSEFIKKSMEVTGEIGKTVGKAGESVFETGKRISESTPIKTMSEGVKTIKSEFDEAALYRGKTYQPPSKLRMRKEVLDPSERDPRIFEPDDKSMGMVLHKDSKYYESWQNFKDNNEFVNKVFDLKMKYDESDNIVIRGTRFFTDKVSSIFGGMFSTTEMSEVLTEICKMDPDFTEEKFMRWCQFDLIPNMLEAILRGEEKILKDWCYEASFNVLMHPITTAKSQGLKIGGKILDVSKIEIAAAKLMEQGPVLVISFEAQQILYVKNAKGEIVEGGDDKILRTRYVWALCRDMEELNPDAAWRLLDMSQQSTDQWL